MCGPEHGAGRKLKYAGVICARNGKGYEILILESTVSFAPLWPTGFVNFHWAGPGGAFRRAGGASLDIMNSFALGVILVVAICFEK